MDSSLFDNGNERLTAPLLCLVGASNELPESEELDALYDRFLIRRQVSQVSLKFTLLLTLVRGFRSQVVNFQNWRDWLLDELETMSKGVSHRIREMISI